VSDEYVVNCADSDELTIAYQVWDSCNNKLLCVPRMEYHLEIVL